MPSGKERRAGCIEGQREVLLFCSWRRTETLFLAMRQSRTLRTRVFDLWRLASISLDVNWGQPNGKLDKLARVGHACYDA